MKMMMCKGSFTIEASVYIPLIMFIMMQVLSIGVYYFQDSRCREMDSEIKGLNIIREFYNYQILEEVGKEVIDD